MNTVTEQQAILESYKRYTRAMLPLLVSSFYSRYSQLSLVHIVAVLLEVPERLEELFSPPQLKSHESANKQSALIIMAAHLWMLKSSERWTDEQDANLQRHLKDMEETLAVFDANFAAKVAEAE